VEAQGFNPAFLKSGIKRPLKEAIRSLEAGLPDEKVPIETIEMESPVETYYSRIIAAGYWPEIKEKLCQFRGKNKEAQDEDAEEVDYRALEEESLGGKAGKLHRRTQRKR
jgi:hypothetical protein